jgi:hypothetical protein
MMVKRIIIGFLVLFAAYILYVVIGMSSTFPSIKKYSFNLTKDSFERKLIQRADSLNGWSLAKEDSIKGDEEIWYWASLNYEGNDQQAEYTVKYCEKAGCVKLEIVGAFDRVNKSGGYKSSDDDVQKLLEILDRVILNDLAPFCSRLRFQ